MTWREKLKQVWDGINKEKDFDPWNTTDKPKRPKITDEEVKKAVEDMGQPKPPSKIPVRLLQGLVILWWIGHFALLYVMIGSPISGGILIYVLLNLALSGHYFILLKVKTDA